MSVALETKMKIAEYLLQIKAIKLQPRSPFIWASGLKSPIYCDNRITLSHPVIRTYIRQQLSHLIQDEFGIPGLIAGVATAGIPQGVLVAQDLGLPFVYVRSAPKGHGLQNLVEGEIKPGQRTIVIEDLVSTGGSSLQAINALRDAGVEVVGLVSIFTYQFDEATEAFKKARVHFCSLSNYDALLEVAQKTSYITPEDSVNLQAWRRDPSSWNQ